MAQLKIIEKDYLKALVDKLDESEGVDRYRKFEPFVLDEGRLLPAPIAPVEATPSLVCATPGSTKEEAENAAKIYRWLKDLTPVQASDPRLWATLTHTHFWAYVSLRWPSLSKSADNPANYIIEHWFTLGSGKAGLRRNAISRLWWAARLTLRPWDDDPGLDCFRTEDPARFTKILLSNAQISFDLLERDYGSSNRIRTCMLDALDTLSSDDAPMTRLSRESAIELNCLARTRNLDAMPVDSLRELCKAIVARKAESLAQASEASAT